MLLLLPMNSTTNWLCMNFRELVKRVEQLEKLSDKRLEQRHLQDSHKVVLSLHEALFPTSSISTVVEAIPSASVWPSDSTMPITPLADASPSPIQSSGSGITPACSATMLQSSPAGSNWSSRTPALASSTSPTGGLLSAPGYANGVRPSLAGSTYCNVHKDSEHAKLLQLESWQMATPSSLATMPAIASGMSEKRKIFAGGEHSLDDLASVSTECTQVTSALQSGTIKKVFVESGFGFIIPDDGLDDVFMHVKDNPELKSWNAGMTVTFVKTWDDRWRKLKATNVNANRPHLSASWLGMGSKAVVKRSAQNQALLDHPEVTRFLTGEGRGLGHSRGILNSIAEEYDKKQSPSSDMGSGQVLEGDAPASIATDDFDHGILIPCQQMFGTDLSIPVDFLGLSYYAPEHGVLPDCFIPEGAHSISSGGDLLEHDGFVRGHGKPGDLGSPKSCDDSGDAPAISETSEASEILIPYERCKACAEAEPSTLISCQQMFGTDLCIPEEFLCLFYDASRLGLVHGEDSSEGGASTSSSEATDGFVAHGVNLTSVGQVEYIAADGEVDFDDLRFFPDENIIQVAQTKYTCAWTFGKDPSDPQNLGKLSVHTDDFSLQGTLVGHGIEGNVVGELFGSCSATFCLFYEVEV